MPQQSPSANRLTERVQAAVRASMPAGGGGIAIACSGGRDSVCLAHATAAVVRPGYSVTLCHVRHNQRPDDGTDVDLVRALAHRLGVASVSEAMPAPASSRPASEGDLRIARYAALARMARAARCHVIFAGHTMDDQAETVLLHLIRGAGLDGLTGMRESAALPTADPVVGADGVHHLRFVRPLLRIRREETAAYCAAHDLPYVDDPSNSDERYARNWLRHTVIPELHTRNAAMTPALARTAHLLAADAEYLRAETVRAFARCHLRTDGAIRLLEHASFAREPYALRLRMVRDLMAAGAGRIARADEVIAAERHLVATTSSRPAFVGGCAMSNVGGMVAVGTPSDVETWTLRDAARRFPLFRGTAVIESGTPVYFREWSADGGVEYVFVLTSVSEHEGSVPGTVLQRAHVSLPPTARLNLRNRLPGDRFRPAPAGRSVRLQDFLTARRIPAAARDWLPVLTVNDTIAAVIGHAASADFRADLERASHTAILVRRLIH